VCASSFSCSVFTAAALNVPMFSLSPSPLSVAVAVC
jgi:hypothetical protein